MLLSFEITGQEVTASRYNEIKYYESSQGGFSMANSRQLGVGIAYTNDGHSAYIVARYLPPGNDYQSNVFPAQC